MLIVLKNICSPYKPLSEIPEGNAFSKTGDEPQYIKLYSCGWAIDKFPDYCACLNSTFGNLCFIPKNEQVIDLGPVKSVEF